MNAGCKNPNECDEGCPGWGFFDDTAVQRCDLCKRFAGDMDAVRHIAECAECQAYFGETIAGLLVEAATTSLTLTYPHATTPKETP